LRYGLARVLVGLSLLGSVVWQVSDRMAYGIFRPTEYFAYFSIVTAVLGGMALLITGLGLILRIEDAKVIEILNLKVVSSLAIVGVVYHLLLSDVENDVRDGDYLWPALPNDIIHSYAPLLAAIVFILANRAYPIRLRAAFWVAVFPLIWLILTLIRGLASNWWPYWFLNPAETGVSGVAGFVAVITAAFFAFGFLLLGAKIGLRKLRRL
jgi:hypothetical protein